MAISAATESCRRRLESCLESQDLMVNNWAENRLMDFNLWDAGVGASAKPSVCLDRRLESQPGTQAVILSLVLALDSFVEACQYYSSDNTDYDSTKSSSSPSVEGLESRASEIGASTPAHTPLSPVEQAMRDTESILDQIIRVGVVVRSSGTTSRLHRADANFSPEDYENLYNYGYQHSSKIDTEDLRKLRAHLIITLTARSHLDGKSQKTSISHESFDFESVLSDLEKDHRRAVEHLIFLNLRRRNRFFHSKMRSKNKNVVESKESFTTDFIEQTQPVEKEEPATARRESYQANDEESSAKAPKKIHSVNETLPSEGTVDPKALQGSNLSYHGMSRKSMSLMRSGWPNPPRIPEHRKTFVCPCCNLTLSNTEAERQAWRRHLSSDIFPFTCIFPDCYPTNVMFDSRDKWKKHLREEHQSLKQWECFVCTNAEESVSFFSEDEFTNHMEKEHREAVPERRIPKLLDFCMKSTPSAVKMCPLCLGKSQELMDPEVLLDHIADHMRDFSLQSLPWEDISETSGLEISVMKGAFSKVKSRLPYSGAFEDVYPPETQAQFQGLESFQEPSDYFPESLGTSSRAQGDSESMDSRLAEDYQATVTSEFETGSDAVDMSEEHDAQKNYLVSVGTEQDEDFSQDAGLVQLDSHTHIQGAKALSGSGHQEDQVMSNKRKTYFFAPGFDNTPSSAINLGDILTGPTLPDRPLNTQPRSSVIAASSIRRTEVTDFSLSLSDRASDKVGLWAQFLQVFRPGAEGSVSLGRNATHSYAFEHMETASFNPTPAFIEESLQIAEVQDHLRFYGSDRPLYIITGIKTTRGATVSTLNGKSHGASGVIGLDATSFGAPVSAGPVFEYEREHKEELGWRCNGPLVFAFQVCRIRVRRGILSVDDHIKGAFTGAKNGEGAGTIEIDDLTILDEREAKDAMEDFEGVEVILAVDESDDRPALAILPVW